VRLLIRHEVARRDSRAAVRAAQGRLEDKEASFDDREMTSLKTSKAVLVAVVTDVVYQPE